MNDSGYFQFGQGDLPAAEQSFRSAVAGQPDYQRAWVNLGMVLAYRTRYDEAFHAFAGIVGPAAAHSNIGTILAKQGRTQEAQQAFRQALALQPNLKQPGAFLPYYEEPRPSPGVVPASFDAAERR